MWQVSFPVQRHSRAGLSATHADGHSQEGRRVAGALLLVAGGVLFLLRTCWPGQNDDRPPTAQAPGAGTLAAHGQDATRAAPTAGVEAASAEALALVAAARSQVGVTLRYDPAYRTLTYPGGDVPLEQGVCTDVVIRALRQALKLDLQKEVHQDMRAHFSAYPQKWGLKRPDKSIDHRRVPNLMTWMERQGWALPASVRGKDVRPGDILTCTVPPSLPHIQIASDRYNAQGEPLILHNIGQGTQEEDRLRAFPLTGHYRLRMKGEPQGQAR